MTSLVDQVRNAVYNIENPNGSKTYQLSFAGGNSGYSFGNTQGDIANNDDAGNTFDRILDNTSSVSGLTADQISSIEDAAGSKGRNSIVDGFKSKITLALNSDYGRSQIDAFDKRRIDIVVSRVKGALATIQKNHHGAGDFDYDIHQNPIGIAELSQYINQFETAPKLAAYLAGLDHAPKISDLEDFISDTKYFSEHPRQFNNFLQKARASARGETTTNPEISNYHDLAIDYDIKLGKTGSWTVSEVRGDNTGLVETLPDSVKTVTFGDGQKFSLVPNGILNQSDLSFVVDTTGSMGPYIDAVKSDAKAIINASSNNGNTDVHFNVVSFKDPTQGDANGVVIPFTTQDDLASRNSTVESAIDSLGAEGGGDIPEDDYGGLLLALNGDAGQWRASAGTRRIILFSDAPVKDTGVTAAVNKYAADENSVVTSSGLASFASGSKATFTLAASAGSSAVPETIEIDTIQVGTDSTATDSLRKIATDNSGSFFDAPTPDDLQKAILDIVSVGPPDTVSSRQTVTSSAFDVFSNNRQPDTTFIFNPGYGIDVVKGFKLGGADHDIIDLPSSDFTGIADVLRHTGDIQGSAWITDPKSGDAIRLAGITTAQLKAHPDDFSFHT